MVDAAAKYGGNSLNDVLLAGPDLLQLLFGVLVRFTEDQIAVVADIKEMFLQVKIAGQDRDSLRLLWREENRREPPQNDVINIRDSVINLYRHLCEK